MKIDILKTKLQTILSDDSLNITKENIVKVTEEVLKKSISKIARINEAMIEIIFLKEKNTKDVATENKELFKLASQTLIVILDKECCEEKNKICDLIFELFINQNFYDLIKDNIPSIKNLVDKLNRPDCIFDIKDILEWIGDDLNLICNKNIENIFAFEYFENEFKEFNKLFINKKDKNFIVKN